MMCFFPLVVGRASFVPLMIWTLYLATHLKALGQGSLDMPLTDWPVLSLWRWRGEQRRGGGGGGGGVGRCKERGRGESEEWRRGEQRRAAAASDPEGAASPLSSPPPLLCHSGLDYFILIRLIPPMEVSCSSPSPPCPSKPHSRSSRQEQSPFSVKGRMRVPLRLIRREKCERWD